MLIKQLVLKKRSYYVFNNSVLLKDFDKTKLKIVKHDCVDRYVYHTDYVKTINNVNPLYLIIPEFYGYIEEHEGRKYLNVALTTMNNNVLSKYEKMWDGILEQVRKINDCANIFEKDYYKIKVRSVRCDDDKDNIDLPLHKLIKFNAVAISNRLLIEKDNRLKNVCTKIIGPNINIKIVVESLKIKSKSNYFWDDMVYLDDFDVKLVNVVRRESRICVDIYYIGYVLEPKDDINSINPLYLIVRHLFGGIEKIEGSSDRYLVVDENNKEVISVFDKLWKFIKDEINRLIKRNDKITFGNADNKISEYNKLRFSSDVDLPLGTLIEFHMLTIVINCVIEKSNKYYPEIYLDEFLYEDDIV